MLLPPKKLLAVYGLKFNPFGPETPNEALVELEEISTFIWRIENLLTEGGIALIVGDPGAGKSAIVRMVEARLAAIPEVNLAKIERPQSRLTDFYFEIGRAFDIGINPRNRLHSFQRMRDEWRSHITATLHRPVVLIDEAQFLKDEVLDELRMLLSDAFDKRRILVLVLAGDSRLLERLKTPAFAPLHSRIHVKLTVKPRDEEDMRRILDHAVTAAGNPNLMTPGAKEMVVAHSAGNARAMLNLSNDLLYNAAQRDKAQIDEKLFMDVNQPQPRPKTKQGRS